MARRRVTMRSIRQTMVYTYFEIGRIVVENEQQGKQRAEYGKQVLKELSKRLTVEFGKGFSVQNLENMRKFFLLYAPSEKSQSPIRIFENNNGLLSWTHFFTVTFMRTTLSPQTTQEPTQETTQERIIFKIRKKQRKQKNGVLTICQNSVR